MLEIANFMNFLVKNIVFRVIFASGFFTFSLHTEYVKRESIVLIC